MLAALLSGALICANGARNLYDMDRAETIVHEEKRYNLDTREFYLYVWYEASPYPLPAGYEAANLHIYKTLTAGVFVFGMAGRFGVKRARKISVGIPLHRADTAHLPADTSLVRASQEPGRESLVRAAARPSDLPDTLLRPAASRPEEHTEQLVRSVGGQEQR